VRDVLGYEGKRVIVAGAGSALGAATAALLVELGAEVHAVDANKPDVPGLASFTECDLFDPHQIDAAVKRIGAYLNALFNCAPLAADAVRQMSDAVLPILLPDSAVVGVMLADGEPVFVGSETVRSNCVRLGAADADAVAWLLAFLNSPRAAAVTGATLVAR
jgi:NAD(P)-dependent dehydrogenase (short-subunit alcohol dehydrogenase family)